MVFKDLAEASAYIENLEKDIKELRDFKSKQGKFRINDIATNVEIAEMQTTEVANSGGTDDDMLNHLKADIESLRTAVNQLIINIQKQ